MKRESKKLIQNLIICFSALALIVSCKGHYDRAMGGQRVEKDCSSIFEDREPYSRIDERGGDMQTRECKILEIKINNDMKCKIVGSDKIDNLLRIIDKNAKERLIIIAPEEKFVEYVEQANKYLVWKRDIDIKKYLDSDLFKNFPFPYKGLKCDIANQEYIIWAGKGRVISTIGKN